MAGTLDQGTLLRLKTVAVELKDGSGDMKFDQVLAEIDLLVAVELAKARHALTIKYLNLLRKICMIGAAQGRGGGPVICGIGRHHRYCLCHRPSIYRPASRGRASHR